ncbi:MAG: tRNA (adenosine(37)-N6)-threonylcarbamoyltransferase complex transferase subunit TsaD [Rhodospirillales bacterium]|nr:MAG: tRNA (adenosine(37)-N6)-threonylcarbamoyltransferase complex transferase subunit TsaD [Rhodospirillales bacterium]
MIVLGLETSCDETAAAVVDDDRRIRAERLFSQLDAHRPFGGVVPEVAARAHLEVLDGLIAEVMAEAGIGFADLDGIAATAGPGLVGGLIVGVMMGKAIAAVHAKPFIAVNHLEAHALTPRLTEGIDFPYLVLLVSGGHCQLLLAEAVGRYRRLGTTLDDALGEAFDKAAKVMGLGYPGGPEVERWARAGNPARFPLPRPMLGRPDCHFSFSGLKTAVVQTVDALPPGPLPDTDLADLSASFQAAAGDVLVDRTRVALGMVEARTLVVVGGVAANAYLRARLQALADSRRVRLVAPPLRLCTDNGAMIAWAGIERLCLGLTDALDVAPRPRWPLDPDAEPVAFAGVKA